MADAPPQLGNIPQTSEIKVPTLSSNTGSEAPASNATDRAQAAKNAVVSNASAAASTVSNHPATQSIKESVQNAPITGVAKEQHAKTSAELNNLAASRKTPTATTTNGQQLTHYHSLFYTLLSWENPRVTALAFLATIVSIFAFRYLPVLRWATKVAYLVLGSAALAEGVGRLALGKGLVATIRPRRYFTLDRDALEASLGDVEQLINFFVIESQRLIFAENVVHSTSAFVAAFLTHWLLKFTPTWGIALLGAVTVYLAPLIYITNREVIDDLLAQASQLVADQSVQIRELAGQHTSKATETLKGYAGEYSAKAQGMIGGATGGKTAGPTKTGLTGGANGVGEKPPAYQAQDFPTAPKQAPAAAGTAPVKSDPLAA